MSFRYFALLAIIIILFPCFNESKAYLDVKVYLHVLRGNWLQFMELQIKGLVKNGLAEHASEIIVCISTPFSNETDKIMLSKLKLAAKSIYSIIPKAKVEATMDNLYEYPGIRKLWILDKTMTEKL
eukprot:gene7275-9917_t